MRRRCVRRGHRWAETLNGWRPPVQFCARWGCDAARPDPTLPGEMKGALDWEIATAPRRVPWRDRLAARFEAVT